MRLFLQKVLFTFLNEVVSTVLEIIHFLMEIGSKEALFLCK